MLFRSSGATPRAPVGSPVALLQIPRIGSNLVVVEGVGIDQLRDGPGHARNTVMPGQPGNAGIAGARLANGAPFRHLDSLRNGDLIVATTLQGAFRYEVARVAVVHHGDPDPFASTSDNRLTLLTSTPVGVANDFLVVTARLLTQPVAIPAGAGPTASPDGNGGLSSGGGVWLGTFCALQLVLLAGWGTRWLFANWAPSVAWMVSAPVLLASLFILFQQASGLFPAVF